MFEKHWNLRANFAQMNNIPFVSSNHCWFSNMWAHLGMEMTKDIKLTRTIGIVSGAVWANEAWGNYWSWDPKESYAAMDLWSNMPTSRDNRRLGPWSFGWSMLDTCTQGCAKSVRENETFRLTLNSCRSFPSLPFPSGCNLVGTPGRARRSEHSASWCEPFGSTHEMH